MSFNKAAQKQVPLEEYEEYMVALLTYKKACSTHTRLLDSLKGRMDAAARLLRADSTTLFKQQCKAYHVARLKYQDALARKKLKDKGFDLSAIELAKSVGISVPVRMKDIIADVKKAAILKSFKDGEFEKLKQETLERISNKSTKDQFISEEADPTLGDFDPI